MPYFTTCPYCGAHLDPCELCDCQTENKEENTNDGNEDQD